MRKKTKIVATISDKKCDVDLIHKLRDNGLNVVRLNTAHMDFNSAMKVIKDVRAVSDSIAILIDTKGPEIRTTSSDGPIHVTFGDRIKLKGDPDSNTTASCLNVNYKNFVQDVPAGSRILIDDGSVELVVLQKENDHLICEVKNQGVIEGRKSVNIPSVHVTLPSLSEKDRDFIVFAIEHDLDFIAHSFVRSKKDVLAIQEILDEKKSQIKIIAKIENQQGVDNIDEILDYAYGIMVARGDLAVEIPQEKIPGIQKQLIEKCMRRRKPVIIATQMLHSMIRNPRPTRAEISDVANAIYDGTDAIMLSGETAYGDYPVESVRTMSEIAIETEKIKPSIIELPQVVLNSDVTALLTIAAVKASVELNAKAIICDTMDGRSIRAMAAYRGRNIIFAQCYKKRVMRELALSYGVYPNYQDLTDRNLDFVLPAINILLKNWDVRQDDRIVVVAGDHQWESGISNIAIKTVRGFLKKLNVADKLMKNEH
ncbi:MAG: pyruvate kinase [Cyclobacteriaceae bacterium]|nr:pyruvate kinase [Cyclobacteriaceae bacterium]